MLYCIHRGSSAALALAASVSRSSNKPFLLDLEDLVFLMSFTPAGSYTLLVSFFTGFPVFCGEGFNGNIPFRFVHSKNFLCPLYVNYFPI